MDKRYQVFISSTSKDLQNARQEVSQALLRSDCFPAQMELWPATDEEQFEFIKQIIQQCDYYIVISAGMYGSIHPEPGLSYTEMEFDYAQEIGIPTIRLLHKDPFGLLKGSQIESTDEAREKLTSFRKKLTAEKLCAFWETPVELGREVILSLNDIKQRKPAEGWVKANEISSSEALIEIADLRRQLSETKLHQHELSQTTNISEIIDSITGNVTLERCIIAKGDEEEAVLSNLHVPGFRKFLHGVYKITADESKVEASEFARRILFGLLFSDDVQEATLRGFSSKETDDSGNPLTVFKCSKKAELQDIFMTLEYKGVITASKVSGIDKVLASHYVEHYRWELTDIGRDWILANKPS